MKKLFSLFALAAAALAFSACVTPPQPPPLAPPVIAEIGSDSPLEAPRYVGEVVTLHVVAVGEDLAYQWFDYYGFPIKGAAGPTWSFVPYTIDQSGPYACEVSNAAGTARAQTYVSIYYRPVAPPPVRDPAKI